VHCYTYDGGLRSVSDFEEDTFSRFAHFGQKTHGSTSCVVRDQLLRQLMCQKGHQFDVQSPFDERVVCPVCGLLISTMDQAAAPTARPDDIELQDSEKINASESKSELPPTNFVAGDVTDRTVILTIADQPEHTLNFTIPPAPAIPARGAAKSQAMVVDAPDREHADSKDANDTVTSNQGRPVSDPLLPKPGDSKTIGPSVPAKPSQVTSSVSRENMSKSYTGVRTTAPMETDIEITEPPELPGYKVINELGRGGMGVVYRTFDEKFDRYVALKTLQRISPLSLQRFKQEFRSLADVSHPNLAAIYDLLSDGKTWCFTMEILEAVDFREYVWRKFDNLNRDKIQRMSSEARKTRPPLTLAILQRLYDGIRQLALGLHALHEAGVLHRDIKPSNILVTTEGRVVLVDFGLASQVNSIGRPKGIQGTLAYMAPEQALCQSVSPASDWYAVGAMLYELLTGRLPIEGRSLNIIARKQIDTPKEPREIDSAIPQELNDLCVGLLQKDPLLRPTVFDVLTQIGDEELADSLRATSSQRTGLKMELVGRERHLETIREAFDQVVAGETRSVFVHGKSGMGKSVLIQTFLDELVTQQQAIVLRGRCAIVLKGRCYEQESVPFKALDSLVDSLADYLNKLPDHVLRQAVPEDSLPLVRLFPVLGQIHGTTDAGKPSIDNVDQQELRQRAMNALREILIWLGQRSPVVLYIDDLQWGDVDSAVLLGDLVRPPESPRVLLLGSYRSEYVQTSPCLKALNIAYTTGQSHPHRQELAVEALQEEDATRLAMLLLGRGDSDTKVLAAKIARESGGWPFFVWELAQHVQDATELSDQSLELDEVIWNRVNRLPDETRKLLELIAVAGRPIVLSEAYRALDVGVNGQNLLVQLRTSNLIRATETLDQISTVETYHDRIRESVVKHLSDRVTKRYNLDLAETILHLSGISVDELWLYLTNAAPFEEPTGVYRLSRQQWRRVYDLSHFFVAAGEQSRALPFAVIAAEQARQQNALEVAEQQFRVALRGCVTSTPALKFRILEGLGDVLMLRGSYSEANEQLQAARLLANESVTLARIDGKLGRSSFKKGDMGDAGMYLEKALTALNERPPGNFLSLISRLGKEGIVQLLHTFFPARFVGRGDKDSHRGRMDLFRARLFDDLTITYWFSRSMDLVLWSHLRQMNLVERYQPTQEMGKAYSFHAITMSAIPLAERGIDYAKRAYQISVDAGDLWGQGKARSFHTFSCIVLARFQEGVKTGEEAVRLLEQAGDVWEANMARMIATVPKHHLGDLKTAYRESRKAYEIGLETGDYSAVCISLLFWIPNAPHLIPPGAIQKELDRKREDPLSIAGAVYARGLELLLCEDKPAEAAQVLQDCLDRAKKRGLRNVCIFSAVTWKATALRIVAERTPDGPQKQAAIRAARNACHAALKITKSYFACRPHALREMGIVAAMSGHEDQARQMFAESLDVATKHEARYDHAKTRLAHAEAGLKFGWPGAAEQANEARAAIRELERVED
jgi:serine/threonine protein kinase/tetratricopeptide (TPR) repeat protein